MLKIFEPAVTVVDLTPEDLSEGLIECDAAFNSEADIVIEAVPWFDSKTMFFWAGQNMLTKNKDKALKFKTKDDAHRWMRETKPFRNSEYIDVLWSVEALP